MIGLFLSIIVIEILLNLYNPFGFRQKGDKITLPSNFEWTYENKSMAGLDSIIIHTKNSLGFRGPDMPGDFDNWTSVIAVGGSTTECFYISDGKDWVSLLGKKLAHQFDHTWTNNAGLDGHSTFGHQILLTDYLVKLEPTYILFLVGCNDVGREDLSNADKFDLMQLDNWKTYLANHSELASLIVNLKRSLQAKQMHLGHKPVTFQSLGLVDRIDTASLHQMTEYHRETFAPEFEKRVAGLVKTTRANNIIPILVTQPSFVGAGVDELTGLDLEKIAFCNDSGGKFYWEKLEVYNDITRKVAKDENIFLIDLAHTMPKSTELFYDCVHYTNKGAEVIAQLLYEEMREIIQPDS